jgi:hypothetical protein
MLPIALLAGPLSLAAEPAEPMVFRPDAEWEAVYGRADRTAMTGFYMSLAAPPLMVVGVIGLAFGFGFDQPAWAAAGALSIAGGGTMFFVGPPMLLGGSLRARYALEQQGLYVSPNNGYAGWACYGGAFVVWPLWFGSVGFGMAQRGANRRALRAAGFEVDLDVELAPWVSPDHAGVALRVAW